MRYILLDGQAVPNIMGICRRHHDKLTDGRSTLVWHEGWWWYRSSVRFVQCLPFDNAGVIAALGGKHCPHCGRPAPKPNPYENRPSDRRRVAVDVPMSAENGAEILASLTEQAGELLGLDNPTTAASRYYTITAALARVLQEKPRRNQGSGVQRPTGGDMMTPRPFDPGMQERRPT